MEPLRPGITVRFATPPEEAAAGARLRLSSGTTAPRGSGPRYHAAALVPAEPWRPPTASESSMLVAPASAPWRRADDVAVVPVAPDVVAALVAICDECGLYDSVAAVGSPAGHPAWQRTHAALADHLRPYRLEGRPIDAAVVYRAEPGLATVTKIDRDRPGHEVYLGLHVDSWEGVSLGGCEAVRNRISVNLSRHRREFLFVNQTLGAMMRALGPYDPDEPVTLFAGHSFLRRFPSYPVVSLTLEHGEAYVAPTGNIVHDGASSPGTEPDVAMHLLGFFYVPNASTSGQSVSSAAISAPTSASPSEMA
jgi:hypothetical protein